MRTWYAVTFMIMVLLVAAAPGASGKLKRLDTDKEGFISLFNGKDLTGWITGPDNAWVVQDGVLAVKRPTDGKEHNSDYLWTDRQYGDFILDLEFKIPERANSGIFLRTSNLKDPVQTGIEVQVANSYGRKQLSRGGTAGAIYDCLAPTKNTIRKPGEWNRCIVTCDDNKIKVVLNGEQIIDMDLDKWTTVHKNPDGTANKFTMPLKNFARKGYIGLQDHGRQIWYRNIRIKPLKKEAQLRPPLASSPPAAVYTLTDDPHGKILKSPDGQVVFRYMTKKPAETNLLANSVCCFHPLKTPTGERITDLAPGDHHHHRGVFLAWHTMDFREKADFTAFGPMGPTYGFNISRADFWGWGEFAPTTGRVIENRSVKLIESDSEEAVLEIRNDWLINKRIMADEKTLATVRKQDGVYIIDLDYRITPAIDMTLNHTAFGGFCVRARNDGKAYYATADGKVKLPDPHYSVPELNWPAKEWYDYTITLDTGKTIAIAVLDHPDNPPATWHNPRYVWMINPCIAADGPLHVSKGKTLRLRYRLVVHDGPTPTKLLQKLSRRWQLTSKASDFKLEPGFVRLDNGKDQSDLSQDKET